MLGDIPKKLCTSEADSTQFGHKFLRNQRQKPKDKNFTGQVSCLAFQPSPCELS